MTFDRPITIQRMDDAEEWHDVATVHAWINKTQGRQAIEAGSMRSYQSLTFRTRYQPWMRDIPGMMQRFRIVYQGRTYSVEDTDDYMERHRVFEIEGVSYG